MKMYYAYRSTSSSSIVKLYICNCAFESQILVNIIKKRLGRLDRNMFWFVIYFFWFLICYNYLKRVNLLQEGEREGTGHVMFGADLHMSNGMFDYFVFDYLLLYQ